MDELLGGDQGDDQNQHLGPGSTAQAEGADEAVDDAVTLLHDDRAHEREQGGPGDAGNDEERESDGGAADQDRSATRRRPHGSVRRIAPNRRRWPLKYS